MLIQQETLGISCYEGALVGASFNRDRLSYTEMYDPEFKYPVRMDGRLRYPIWNTKMNLWQR